MKENELNNLKIMTLIEDGRLRKVTDITEYNLYNNSENFYLIIDDNNIIVDLDKNSIKPYVKYLIKGMDGSRELASILINRYIQIFILIMLVFTLYQITQRPNETKMIELINSNGKQTTIIDNLTNQRPKTNTGIIIK